MNFHAELHGNCRDLAASNMSTTLRVLKCCRDPGGDCGKRTGRPSVAKEKKFEDQSSLQSPRISHNQ